MGAMFPPSQWPPEDDVMLKSAVESGASLESLAKGAVQFSRRYTVKELQDRWYSLLYDPVVSAEAAPHMLEVMRSGFSHQPKSNKLEAVKEAALTSGKRKKAENIRKCYYAMRKRICNEPLDIMGIDLLPGSSAANFGDGSGLGIQGPDFDIGPHLFPELGPNSSNDLQFGGQVAAHDLPPFTYEDSTLPLDDGIPGFNQSDLFGPEAHLEGPGFRACDSGPFRNLACSSSSMPQMPMWDDSTSPDMCAPPPDQLMARDEFVIPPSCNVNVTDTYLAELSNTLFSDDLHCSDSSPKDGIDASYLEGLSSLLTFDASPSQIELDGTSGGPHLLCEVPHKAAASPIPESKELGPEYQNGVICCTLNTEDPNIPDNDDVFLPVRLPSPTYTPSGFHWKFEDPTSTTDLPNVARKVKVKVGPPAMKNNGGPSHFEGLTGPLDKCSKYSVADKGVKFELPKSNIQQAVLRNVRKGEGYSSRASSANNNENCNVGGVAKEGSVDVDQGKKIDCEPIEICLDKRENDLDILESLQKNDNVKVETPNVGLADDETSCRKTIALPIDESRVLDMEEWSENDVPCFSDVEAMILDMDLSPDLYTNPEVQRYMLEESKNAIVRLEQSADSCSQRTFARQGAFAVLYGRWSKHFIKKPEVILGRSTEESKVDIDLGREKNGGKISRRQAIIKMDMHGTFQLINVGKSWVYVNGKEVLPCQSLSLTSGCLIEVRGLAFIFETSRANINIYLNSIVGGDQPSGHRSLKGI